jgi:DNA-binding HxlR family transcriptional regulator
MKTDINKKGNKETESTCIKKILAAKDAVEVLDGRWKMLIIVSLSFSPKRFNFLREKLSISDKSLAKQLKELETSQVIKRTTHDSFPPSVEYSLTEHGLTLEPVIRQLVNWGELHREKILGKRESKIGD